MLEIGESVNGFEIIEVLESDARWNRFYLIQCCICDEMFRCRSDKIKLARCCLAGETNQTPYEQMKNIRKGIIDRCYRPERHDYKNYGGRGIKMCDKWKNSLKAFIEDVHSEIGERPAQHYTLDRVDNNGNYEPGNIRWLNYRDQRMNR
jgi:hypothetical protein